MNIKGFSWTWILAIVVGFGLGLTYAWTISPVEYVDANPQALRDDFKDQFRSAIAAAYASNADLERARARLALLGDPNPSQALTAQAQRMVSAGEPPEAVQQVAMLASALQGQIVNSIATNIESVPTTDIQTSETETALPVTTTATQETVNTQSTNIPALGLTATPRPTRTPTPTLGAPYQLIGQDTLCDAELAEGLLQIMVTTITRKQIPGAEIIITWDGGEEHIFTGLKPELGNGYADFIMSPNETYSIRMADGGTSATDVTSPDCTDTDQNPYLGSISISFQQP